MSADIYTTFFEESTTLPPQLSCQYVECSKPLARKGKFCNLICCNRENARRQKIMAHERYQQRKQVYELDPLPCKQCCSPIPYSAIAVGPAKFCSHSCSATYNNKIRSPISRKLQGQRLRDKSAVSSKAQFKYSKIEWFICEVTQKPYHNRTPLGGRRQVSPYIKDLKSIYYQLAHFKFNVYKMPKLFDLSLLETYGWYTCPGRKRGNHKKNTQGVSRDHLFSVAEGFVQKVDPLILSHPANCKLVQHAMNKEKQTLCTITLQELLSRIENFDNKTHVFAHHELILDIITKNKIYVQDINLLRQMI